MSPRLPAFAVAVVVAATVPASAAAIDERRVVVVIEGDAAVQTEELTIAIRSEADARSHAFHAIPLDAHVALQECRAEVLGADGEVRERVPARRHRRVDSAGFGLYTSAWAQVVPWPPLRSGDRLRLSITTRHTPLFRGHVVVLPSRDETARLAVEVRGPATLRHVLDRRAGGDDDVSIEVDPGTVRLEATALAAAADEALMPSGDDARPRLVLAWGEERGWDDVGRWYDRLVGRPEPDPAMTEMSRRLASGKETRDEKIDALVHHVKTAVRYEAVEIGAGGWIPSPAGKVAARGWGDCKDKSELLRQLLAASGFEARLALLRSGLGARIDEALPTPQAFNHCIVALREGDGWSFIDPTVEHGPRTLIDPSSQGAQALVVDGANSRLVPIPVLHEDERRALTLKGRIDGSGALAARLSITLSGGRALRWLHIAPRLTPGQVEDSVRQSATSLLPGALVSRVEWKEERRTPAVELSADVTLEDAIRTVDAERRSMSSPKLEALPEPRLLDAWTSAAAVNPGVQILEVVLALPPEWCPPVPFHDEVDNACGRVTASVTTSAGELRFRREVVLRRTRVEPAEIDLLRALCIAARKGDNRRLEMRCAP